MEVCHVAVTCGGDVFERGIMRRAMDGDDLRSLVECLEEVAKDVHG